MENLGAPFPATDCKRLHTQQVHSTLQFQIPVRVDELDRRRQFKIRWSPDAKLKTEMQELTLYPERDGTVKHVLDEMRRTLKATSPQMLAPDAKLR